MLNATIVSVIVPVFNAERYILRTLASLAKQTLPNIEIIIIDDSSTDSSQSVIKKYQNQSQLNIVYLRQPDNQGVHNARLLGLQQAKGEWIGFVDADDTIQPEMYEKMLDAGIRKNVDIVICGAYRVTENGKRLSTKVSFKKERKVTENVFQEFCHLNFGTGTLWNKLYRREVIMPLKVIQFPWRQDINEDMLLNIGCFSKAKSVLAIEEILYNYTDNLESVSSVIDSTSAFVKTFRAYALAVSSYDFLDDEDKLALTGLYRRILDWPTFQVEQLSSLTNYSDELVDAIRTIHASHPIGVAALTSRFIEKPTKKRRFINFLKKLTLRA